MDVINKIGVMFDVAQQNLESQYYNDRKSLSAQSAISKNNTASALMQKGLSKSGESVQSSILGDMSYMNALSKLASDNTQKMNELTAQRFSAIAGVRNDMLNAQNEADRLDYQRERDKALDERWEKEFNYNASRDSAEDYKWNKQMEYQKQRDFIEDDRTEREIARDIYEDDRDYKFGLEQYEDEKAQTAVKNALAQTELDIKKTQNDRENYLKNQYLLLEKEKLQKEDSSSKAGEDYDFGYSVNSKGYIVPDVPPDEFLDIMLKGSGTWGFGGLKFVSPDEFELRVREMLKEERLDPDYLNLMEIYARGRGIIRDDLD